MIVVDLYVYGGFWVACYVFIACLQVITPTVIQTAGVGIPLYCSRLHRAYRAVQAVLTAVVLVVNSQ